VTNEIRCAEVVVQPAEPADAGTIARLHVRSWRSAYVGMLPQAFLDGPVGDELPALWRRRFSPEDDKRKIVLKAMHQGALVGFACVLPDADPSWGPLLDNLHVEPDAKRHGIGRLLFDAVRAAAAPASALHLWVLEANEPARRFYERLGGEAVETTVVEVTPSVWVTQVRYLWR
jgi:GNAT superfamily N-acetyltransferase